MVHHDKAGSDRHQSVAQTVQSHPSASGPEYATASDGNSSQEWHRTPVLDSRRPLRCFSDSDTFRNFIIKRLSGRPVFMEDPAYFLNPPSRRGSCYSAALCFNASENYPQCGSVSPKLYAILALIAAEIQTDPPPARTHAKRRAVLAD